MSLYLLQTALRELLEPQLATLPLAARQGDADTKPEQAATRAAFVRLGRPPDHMDGDYEIPLVLIQAMSGHDEDGFGCAVMVLRIIVWNEDAEALEKDFVNLLGLLRRSVLVCRQNPLADKYVLVPDKYGHLAPWVRLGEQSPQLLSADVFTDWKMQGF